MVGHPVDEERVTPRVSVIYRPCCTRTTTFAVIINKR